MSNGDPPKHQAPAPAEERRQEERFLRRWSRRKQEARVQEPSVPHDARPAEPPKAPEKALTDADMPPLESLDEKSDFSVFMSPGVSEALRGRALRKLFMLPEINRRCPIDGEWYDCHGFEPLGDIITHEMREEMERAALKLKESAKEALLKDEPETAAATDTAAAPVPTQEAAEPTAAPAVGAGPANAEGKRLRGHVRKRRAPDEANET